MVVGSPEHCYTVQDNHNTLLSQLGFKKLQARSQKRLKF